MARTSPKTCTPIPANANPVDAGERNKNSAPITIVHPAANRKKPAGFILSFLTAAADSTAMTHTYAEIAVALDFPSD
jgi:hypothetical protein